MRLAMFAGVMALTEEGTVLRGGGEGSEGMELAATRGLEAPASVAPPRGLLMRYAEKEEGLLIAAPESRLGGWVMFCALDR